MDEINIFNVEIQERDYYILPTDTSKKEESLENEGLMCLTLAEISLIKECLNYAHKESEDEPTRNLINNLVNKLSEEEEEMELIDFNQ